MNNLKKQILESRYLNFINSLSEKIKNGGIKPPYFKKLSEDFELNRQDINLVLSMAFNAKISVKDGLISGDNVNYVEFPGGFWEKSDLDEYGNSTYIIDSDGNWDIFEYDDEIGEIIYHESNDGVHLDVRSTYRENIG